MALFVWEPHKERTWPSFLVTTQCVFNPWAHWLGKLLPDVHQVDCEVRPLAADGPIPSFTAGFCYYQWVVSKKTTILCAIHGSISVYLKPFSFVNCWLVLGCLQRMIHFKTHRWFYWGKRIIGCGLETGGILWGQGLTFQPFQFFAQGDLNCPANPFRWHGLVDDGWLRFLLSTLLWCEPVSIWCKWIIQNHYELFNVLGRVEHTKHPLAICVSLKCGTPWSSQISHGLSIFSELQHN